MAEGYICAAGVDLQTGARVRPVLFGRLSSGLLCTHGGPLDIGNIVEFGRCQPRGSAPHVEDMLFDERNVRLVNRMSAQSFWLLLEHVAVDSLSVFGSALVRLGNSLVTEHGSGLCSLALLRAPVKPVLNIHDFGDGPRLRFRWLGDVGLAVTDVRMYEDDLRTPDPAKLMSLQRALASPNDSFLSFGLTRASPRLGNRHYLQLNNIHVPNWPDWRLCP
jgi:hypothetical protein